MSLYAQVKDQLYKSGSYSFNTWYPVSVLNDETGERIEAEAADPSRGELRLRKLVRDNIYQRFRFNKKKELVYEGLFEFTEETSWHGVEVYFFKGHKIYA